MFRTGDALETWKLRKPGEVKKRLNTHSKDRVTFEFLCFINYSNMTELFNEPSSTGQHRAAPGSTEQHRAAQSVDLF